ncbi:MAG: glycosyltransferase [Burkholderiales bacterium]
MRILFVHQNFPGQYAHLLAHYASDPANEIVFLTRHVNAPFKGIRKIVYRLGREAGAGTHFYLRSTEGAVLHGQAVARVALRLKKEGFVPDVILGHNAWGETLYLKDVYPDAPLLAYFEYYYRAQGGDIGFDPEFPETLDVRLRVRTLNAVNLMGLEAADRGQTATEWQHSTYPERYRDMIAVAHEGIDTERVKPDRDAKLVLPDGRELTRGDEVITYVARNLEPYRGFHVFMRALPEILRRRPKARIVIVGGDEVSYGRKPGDGRSWRETMLAEVGAKLDLSRVHLTGRVPYGTFLNALQVSSAHVYLTYPFVLSWSMLDAMAAGCTVIASGTPPVKEVIRDDENGLLVDFFDAKAIVDRVNAALGEPKRYEALRVRARNTLEERFDLKRVCLPRQIALVESLLGGTRSSPPRVVPPSGQLSARETEVLGWLRQGKSAWEVAQILGRSEHTVKNQMRNLYEKLGASNRVQALQRASRLVLPERGV